METEKQFIGFRLDDRDFAVDILDVREIVRAAPPTPLPRTDPRVAGVINLRDETIAVLDLAPRQDPPEDGGQHIMVLTAGGRTAGLRVDAITGVVHIPAAHIEPFRPPGDGDPAMAVSRIARMDDGLLLLPDLGRMLGALPKDIDTAPPPPLPKENGMPDPVEARAHLDLQPVEQQFLDRVDAGFADAETTRRLFQEVRNLMTALAGGRIDSAEKAVDAMARLSEKKLLDEVGSLTRNLHESLKEFRRTLDPKIKSLATQDMPEAADSLQQVILMTGRAADRTLTTVEAGQSDVAGMKKRLIAFRNDLDRLRDGHVDTDLLTSLDAAAVAFDKHLDRTLEGYTEIIMSQDFQDLTGQIIKRIIKLVHELEDQLVTLIQNFGVEVQQNDDASEKDLKGPVSNTRIDQSDVDDLLSSFGF